MELLEPLQSANVMSKYAKCTCISEAATDRAKISSKFRPSSSRNSVHVHIQRLNFVSTKCQAQIWHL